MQLEERFEDAGLRDRISRPRLENRLVGAPVTVLIGPAGSGKGEVLRALRTDPMTLYYRVGRKHATFARFVHGLAAAVAAIAPGALASFPRAWERALQSHSPAVVLGHWMCEHLNGSSHHLAIDDLHDVAADLSIASFIATLAERRPDAKLTLAARSVGALPIALWMATGRMERPIDEMDLRFDRAEIVAAASVFGVELPATAVDALLNATHGLPIAISYALTRWRCEPRNSLRMSTATTFIEIAHHIFARRTRRQRAFLCTAALFPSPDETLLARSGWKDAAAIQNAMADDAEFMWAWRDVGGFRFHDRFREFLLQQFEACDPSFRSIISGRVVQSLRLGGAYAAALEVATSQHHIQAMGELLETHGFEVLESGQVDVICEALTAYADAEKSVGAGALALRGYMEARAGHLDTAEAWFRLGLDKADGEASRVAIAMYYARELALRRREDAHEVLEPYADSTTLPRWTLIDVRSAYAQALTAANRVAEASTRTADALALLDSDSPPALRGRVFARAAYVAMESGDVELARSRGAIAAPLAVAHSLYDVAASTYSVLYNIAYDIDDDAVSCIDYLHRVRDLGAKSGTLRLELYVMLSLYELFAEAGDEAALIKLDHQLSNADKHDAVAAMTQSLLPAKALEAGWRGDFEGAQQLLRPTADRQATPTRLALRWAHIALYCAAARDAENADSAARTAQLALQQSEAGTTQFALTLLLLALTNVLCANLGEARRWASAADDAISGPAPRLRALRQTLEVLIVGWNDTEWLIRRLPSALGGLWNASFGGMARLIEALPYHGAVALSPTATIGSILATHELVERFALAVESGDVGPLRGWLDTLRDHTFDGVGLVGQFERWAAAPSQSAHCNPAAIATLRRKVAAYGRPAAVVLRLGDDIDASIDALFERLDSAAPLMAEHSRAVSAWCSRLGRIMGLSESEITFVARCGLIHDIGKMRTPAAILGAARQLNEQEWAIMRDHAAEGGRILSEVPVLRVFVPIVRAHHERLDGAGYPDGLRSSAIPVAARIVSVADSFNAMIGRRPYRLPLPPTEALNELTRHCGTQFDPEIVEAMVRVALGRPKDTLTQKD